MTEYQPNIPLAFDVVQESQSSIQKNFSEANRLFGENHYPYDSANGGKHKYSVYVEQQSLPGVEDDEIALFNQEQENQRNNLYLRYQNNGFTFPFLPYMLCYIRLENDSVNQFTVLGTSLNFDVEKSGWNFRTATLYFQFPTKNINYFVEITKASSYTTLSRMFVANKNQGFFEVKTSHPFVAGDQIQVRVY